MMMMMMMMMMMIAIMIMTMIQNDEKVTTTKIKERVTVHTDFTYDVRLCGLMVRHPPREGKIWGSNPAFPVRVIPVTETLVC